MGVFGGKPTPVVVSGSETVSSKKLKNQFQFKKKIKKNHLD